MYSPMVAMEVCSGGSRVAAGWAPGAGRCVLKGRHHCAGSTALKDAALPVGLPQSCAPHCSRLDPPPSEPNAAGARPKPARLTTAAKTTFESRTGKPRQNACKRLAGETHSSTHNVRACRQGGGGKRNTAWHSGGHSGRPCLTRLVIGLDLLTQLQGGSSCTCSVHLLTTTTQSHTALTGVLVAGLIWCHQREPGTAPSREKA